MRLQRVPTRSSWLVRSIVAGPPRKPHAFVLLWVAVFFTALLALLHCGPPSALLGVGRQAAEATRKNIYGVERTVLVEYVGDETNKTMNFTRSSKDRYYRNHPEYMNRYALLPQPNQIPDEQRICFVHIGKTAGSTLSCVLGFENPKCRNRLKLLPGNSPLQQRTTSMVHVRRDNCRSERAVGWYLFAARDPLQRLQSWLAYDRPGGSGGRSGGWRSDRRQRKSKPLYGDCGIGTMNQLGQAMSTDKDSNTTQECSRIAWRAVTGKQGFAYHNAMNYGYYWNRLPEEARIDGRILVIRTEHLEQDWFSAERVLTWHDGNEKSATLPDSGSNSTPAWSQAVFGKTNESKQKKKRDKDLSDTARHNVCAGLCHEIQIYKELLRRAENLSPADVSTSMKQLEQSCPVQAVSEQCPSLQI